MTHRLTGTAVTRVEDPPLLVGNGSFVADLHLDNALVAHYVVSDLAHALIRSVDVCDAGSMPGVVDVVTAADLDGVVGPLPGLGPGLPPEMARPALAGDRVRYVGEPVVAIVAETSAQAVDAAEAVIVDYEPLPPVIGFDAALHGVSSEPGTLLFPEVGSNVAIEGSGADPEPYDLDRCEVVIEVEMINQRVAPCPIESRVGAAYWTDDGRLVHHAASQGVHPIRNSLAAFYELSPERVRVLTADVGGSFGAKARLYPEEILLALLSRRTGRPVRWVPDRTADMVGLGHSRCQRQRVRIGGTGDGLIQAIVADITGDCGAYPAAAPALMDNAGMVLPGPFDVAGVHWTGRVVVTNTTPIVPYRGAGRPEGGAMLNRAIDVFAHRVGLDPLDVRRRNLLEADDLPWRNPTGLVYDSGDYRRALELAAAEVGYDRVRQRQAEERAAGSTRVTGIGWGTFIDRTAGLPSDDYGCVQLRPDGTFRILTSSSPYGQGHHTGWAMLLAERTGVDLDRIEVVHGDTDVVPMGGVTGGSRSTQRAGVAVTEAADELVRVASAAAAELLEASADDITLDLDRGRFHVVGSPAAAGFGWAALADRWPIEGSTSGGAGEDPTVAAGHRTLHGRDDHDIVFECESQFSGDGPGVPYGMYVAVVEVDLETGEVDLRRMVSVDDAGTVLNPMLVEGQLHGGIAQGIGQALFEEFLYDADGNPLTSNFLDYGIPSAADMPSFEVHVLQSPSPNNPPGFKGVAESGCIGAVPAVQNAVVDAVAHLGIDHIDLPLTPERVWLAVSGASGR